MAGTGVGGERSEYRVMTERSEYRVMTERRGLGGGRYRVAASAQVG